VSEWELRERRGHENELSAEATVLGTKDELGDGTVPTHALLHGTGGRGVGDEPRFPLLFPLWFSLVRIYFLSGQA